MDLHCVKCGEPWDNDTFHEIADETDSTYKKVARDFHARGCVALGENCGVPTDRTNRNGLRPQDAAAALADLLGDDTDGIAAMMQDEGF